MHALEGLDRVTYQTGQIIFAKGEVGDSAFLIEAGEVEILVESGGQQRRVSTLGAGELIGEIALIDQQPRTATVRATKLTVLVQVRHELVEELLAKTDPVIRHLLRVVLERFRATQSSLTPQLVDEMHIEFQYPQPTGRLHETATHALSLAQDIAHALLSDQFQLFYQPIVQLSDGRVAGFEALIRWNHPTHGMISPLDFLGLAEQTGQIRAIGLWTLERACRDWATLKAQTAVDHPTVSVNLSANQLTGSLFIEDVKQILHRTQMDPAHLKLELTETIIIGRPEIAEQILRGLLEVGLSLALDDFGTGYSGLDHLQRYPIGTLKVDRAFISQILESKQSLEIVKATVQLGLSLGIDVVAEGIETEEEAQILRELNCEFGQGWHFGRPQPLSHIR